MSYASRKPRSRLVPGHGAWRARVIRDDKGQARAVRVRHRVLAWRAFTVATRDLRQGAELAARMLDSRAAGLPAPTEQRQRA